MTYREHMSGPAPQLTFDELQPVLASAELQPDSLEPKTALQMVELFAQLGAAALITDRETEFGQWQGYIEAFGTTARTVFSSDAVYTKGTTTLDAYGVAYGHESSVANFRRYLSDPNKAKIKNLRTLVSVLAEEDRSPEPWIDSVLSDPTRRAIMNRMYFLDRQVTAEMQGRPFNPYLHAHQGMRAASLAASRGELYDPTMLILGADLLLASEERHAPELVEKFVMASQSTVDWEKMPNVYTNFLDIALTALSNSSLDRTDRQYIVEELYRTHDMAFQSGVSENTPKVSNTPAPQEVEAVLALEMNRMLIQKGPHHGNTLQESVVKACRAAIINNQPEIAQALMQKIDSATNWSKLAQQYADWVGDVGAVQPDDFVSIMSPGHKLYFNVVQALQRRELSSLSGAVQNLARYSSPDDFLAVIPYIRRGYRIDPATGLQITRDLTQLTVDHGELTQMNESLHILRVMQGEDGVSQDYYALLQQNRERFSPLDYLRAVARYHMAHCGTM